MNCNTTHYRANSSSVPGDPTAGDVNGDGFADVIVGADYYDAGEADEGRAFVFLGSANGLVTSAPAWSAEGNQAGAAFGRRVAAAGDVNGDGYGDVLVGAHTYDGGDSDEGRAYLYLGSGTGLSSAPDWTFESDQAGANLGSVAGAGDVNGDGFADVLVSAYLFDNGESDEGRVWLFLGGVDGLATTAVWSAEGDQIDAHLGAAIAAAGDVDADGHADVIVGALTYDNGQSNEGRAYVYLGTAGGLASSPVWTAESNQADANFGSSVAGVGDLNGDGYGDIVVGAPALDLGQTNEGVAFVFQGSAAGPEVAAAVMLERNVASASFGSAVASAGDVNGDGYADLLVAASTYTSGQATEGGAFVYLGSPTWAANPSIWTGESNQASAYFGSSAAAAGDVNGDGFGDIVVGAFRYDGGQTDEGRIFVFRGAGSTLGSTTSTFLEPGSPTTGAFGDVVASAGDVNGDGFADVIVGQPTYPNYQNTGRALIYFGSAAGLSTTAGWTVVSPNANASFGTSVASAGDVNGDGYGDVIVGSYSNGVFVYHGSASGPSLVADYTRTGSSSLGVSVAAAGDVNGDGFGDIIIAAPFAPVGGFDSQAGQAMAIYGSSTGLGSAGWAYSPNQAYGYFGSALASAGDVNGDGFADVVVGAPAYDYGFVDSGAVFGFFGSATGLSSTPSWIVGGGIDYARIGNAVASGDFNQDGYDDILAGGRAYAGSPAISTQGRAWLFTGYSSGIQSTAIWSYSSAQAGAELGASVAIADVNGDGSGDIFVAAPYYDGGQADEGRASMFLGSPIPAAAPSWTFEPNQAGAWLGVVASAGDINGDGYGDIVAGARGYDNPSSSQGHIFVLYGNGGDGTTAASRAVAQPRRVGVSTPIAPWGASSTIDGFEVAARGRSPFGRMRVKLEVEVKGLGALFTGAGVVRSASWMDAQNVGAALSTTIGGLEEAMPYHWRARILYHPGHAAPQGWSHWSYGGLSGATQSVHLRTGCSDPAANTDGDAVTNCKERCDSDPNKIAPGQCGCGFADIHSDTDGVADCNETCDTDPNKRAPGICGCGVSDANSDGDSQVNCNETCDNDPNKLEPGICGCGVADVNTDGDGQLDCNETCDSDPNKLAPGACGCGVADTNTDGDSAADCNETCDTDPNKLAPGQCGCGQPDTNTDGDSAADCNETCDSDPSKLAPGICGCGVSDANSDGDSQVNCNETCDNDPNKLEPGICGCGVADTNSDGDSAVDCNETCDSDPNKLAPGICGCGVADTNTDGDSAADCHETCDNDPNKLVPGVCGCGVADSNADGDSQLDCNELCDDDPDKLLPGICGCGIADTDTDGDGTADCNETCDDDPDKQEPGACGCGVVDTDTDGDGNADCNETCDDDPDKLMPGACGCGIADTDTDGDSSADCNELCDDDPDKLMPGACGCGIADTDTDGDSTADCDDGCLTDPAKTAPGLCGCGASDADTVTDSDDDGATNCVDADDDDDAVPDAVDNCPTVGNADQVDEDGDGRGAACDGDDSGAGGADVQSQGCGCGGAPDAGILPLLLLWVGRWRRGRRRAQLQ